MVSSFDFLIFRRNFVFRIRNEVAQSKVGRTRRWLWLVYVCGKSRRERAQRTGVLSRRESLRFKCCPHFRIFYDQYFLLILLRLFDKSVIYCSARRNVLVTRRIKDSFELVAEIDTNDENHQQKPTWVLLDVKCLPVLGRTDVFH